MKIFLRDFVIQLVDWEVNSKEYTPEELKLQGLEALPINLAKRIFDICLSLAAIVFFLPIGGLLSLAILIEDRGPIFYAQKRLGRGGRYFYIFKFRSMIANADKHGDLGGERGTDWRITKVGFFMRNTAMDELPNLWNIVIGDMSFVGPRPERPANHALYCTKIPCFSQRLRVTSGLICLAALCNVDTENWAQEMRREIHYDGFYISKYSFLFDVILIVAGLRTTIFLNWGTEKRKI